MNKSRILIFGSRALSDPFLLEAVLYKYIVIPYNKEDVIIVHGACPNGADKLADTWAKNRKYEIDPYPADWYRYGKQAGFIRNKIMVDKGADLAIGFFNGLTPGSKDTLHRCIQARIETIVVSQENNNGNYTYNLGL